MIPDGALLVTRSWDYTVRLWNLASGELLATLHNSKQGFLWTTPPDKAAPSGWFWTDRPELIHLVEVDQGNGAHPKAVLPDDPRWQAYINKHNNQEMVMARLHSLQEYRKLLANYLPLIGPPISDAEQRVRLLLDAPHEEGE
jgi:hypothetical protein